MSTLYTPVARNRKKLQRQSKSNITMRITDALSLKSSAEGDRQSIMLALSAKKRSKKIDKLRSGVTLSGNRKAHIGGRERSFWMVLSQSS